MTQAVRRSWVRKVAGVFGFNQYSVAAIAQTNCAGAVLQAVSESALHAADPIEILHISRRGCDHQIRPGADSGVRRKGVLNGAGQTKPAEVFRPAVRVEELDVFQIFSVHAVSRVIHDFRNDQTGAAVGRTDWLDTAKD